MGWFLLGMELKELHSLLSPRRSGQSFKTSSPALERVRLGLQQDHIGIGHLVAHDLSASVEGKTRLVSSLVRDGHGSPYCV